MFLLGIIWENISSNWDAYMAGVFFILLIITLLAARKSKQQTTRGYNS